MSRRETDLDPTFIRTPLPELNDPSVEATILDPAMAGAFLPPEIKALANAWSESVDCETRMGMMVVGYDEQPLPKRPAAPELPFGLVMPVERAELSAYERKSPPPSSATAVFPRELSEPNLFVPLSFHPRPLPPPPAPRPVIANSETLAFGSNSTKSERPVPSEPKAKIASQPKAKVLSEPKLKVVSEPKLKVVSEPKAKALSEPKAKALAFDLKSTSPVLPLAELVRPRIDVMPQRYIPTVVTYPRPGMPSSTLPTETGLFSRIKSWFLPKRPGFVNAPPRSLYPRAPGRAGGHAR